jgi:V-type H+-transporting ATPase subunit a
VTFPFLFGVMFGDIAHGGILLMAGIFLCLFESCLRNKMSLVLRYRYLILLLGIFATFTGVVYNDMMAIPLYLFDSCYNQETGAKLVQHGSNSTIIDDCSYPIGIDPVWYLSKNELQFMNSLKMKIAVILGVLQMSLGVFMKAFNALHFRNALDFIHEFIP